MAWLPKDQSKEEKGHGSSLGEGLEVCRAHKVGLEGLQPQEPGSCWLWDCAGSVRLPPCLLGQPDGKGPCLPFPLLLTGTDFGLEPTGRPGSTLQAQVLEAVIFPAERLQAMKP